MNVNAWRAHALMGLGGHLSQPRTIRWPRLARAPYLLPGWSIRRVNQSEYGHPVSAVFGFYVGACRWVIGTWCRGGVPPLEVWVWLEAERGFGMAPAPSF